MARHPPRRANCRITANTRKKGGRCRKHNQEQGGRGKSLKKRRERKIYSADKDRQDQARRYEGRVEDNGFVGRNWAKICGRS